MGSRKEGLTSMRRKYKIVSRTKTHLQTSYGQAARAGSRSRNKSELGKGGSMVVL